jgi:hypothetical protein
MATQITLLEKYRMEDHLVTKVQYDFTDEVTSSIVVEIYHFRPTSEVQVEQNIINRGESEKSKLISQQIIDQILPNIEI